ncbi:hypothetical protein [Anaerospora hongkongensis]|uniref:hypothetical protein n=1 Tax=Anaerospora hongkongensis TaxID=244830 RepID=UPI0028985554|nr:hypothetical protein [Anaerospora hongkongensis]
MANRKSYFIFLLTGFLGGLCAGAILVTAYTGHELDTAYQHIHALQTTLKEKDALLEKLEVSSKKKATVIKKIEVDLQLSGDQADKDALMIHVKEQYYPLFGKEVTNLNPDLLTAVIDNRVIRLEDRDFRLSVRKMVISDTLKIWVTAVLLSR